MSADTGAKSRKSAIPSEPANLWSEYEIEAKTSLTDRQLRNLKFGDAFAVTDANGDIGTIRDTAEGLYFRDTRYLSYFEMRLEGKRPLLLSSSVHEDKAALSVELTNPDIDAGNATRLSRNTVFIHRMKFLSGSSCYDRFSIRNFSSVEQHLRLDFLYRADFFDLFEIRGTRRPSRGLAGAKVLNDHEVEFRYMGLDGVERRTILRFEPKPVRIDEFQAAIDCHLRPFEHFAIFVRTTCVDGAIPATAPQSFFTAYRAVHRARRKSTAGITTVTTSNESLNDVLCRATSDIYTLTTKNAHGLYPYAGIPWFNTIFGRDGLITAMLMLWIDPSIARGVLLTLAATQATIHDPPTDAQPGKILHELRHGEMARLGEVPFGRYYGTVDATPLFIVLAGMYRDVTGDDATLRQIWPNILAALDWIDRYGDIDGDGFVEYQRERPGGLANQGWKDSHDAIFHQDGTGATGPIALCEVQGYVYAAKRHAAMLARHFGDAELADALEAEAAALFERFNEIFWCDDLGTYALALDGEKRVCRVIASNAGHALFAGIARADHAEQVAATLTSADSFGGWGIRTLACGQPRYNPMSYHNGSVWPHDNAVIAIGLARYGLKREAAALFSAVFDAARHQELARLPELFCGFTRRQHRAPTPYPVACAPQAWSATSIFGLLGACLGLEISHARQEIRFRNPVMPDSVDELIINRLQVGGSSMTVRLHRYGNDVTANVLSRQGDARLIIEK